MENEEKDRPWELIKSFIDEGNVIALKEELNAMTSEQVNLILSHLNKEDRSQLIALLPLSDATEIIQEIPEVMATEILENLSSNEAANIIEGLKSNEQADILNEFEDNEAEAIIAEMQPENADNIKKLIQYGPDTAGGLMVTEFLAFEALMTVSDVVTYLRDHSDTIAGYTVQYIYVTSKNKFLGVLQMRDLILKNPEVVLEEIAIKNALTVHENASLNELITFFDTYDFYGVPVLDNNGALVGLVMRKDIRKEEVELANMELLETQGIVGGEELRTMPFLLRSRRRLSWLSVNIVLNIVAASVIAMYQDTLSTAIALAVFLPIISDMSGCSGNQAVAVSLRELSLGVVKPFELRRVWLQELSVGLINGLTLGLLLGVAAWLWQGNIYLGMIVGGALCLNTIIAVSIGGTIPLALKMFNVDPALASGPILTTITDMLGFFLALSFATMALAYL